MGEVVEVIQLNVHKKAGRKIPQLHFKALFQKGFQRDKIKIVPLKFSNTLTVFFNTNAN